MNAPAAAEGWPTRPGDAAQVPTDELATHQKVRPVSSLDELEADVWDSDDELEAFLASTRTSRDVNLA